MRLRFFGRFAAFAAAVLLLVTASAGNGPVALAGGEPGAQGTARAIAAQEAHTNALMAIDGVVGTGVGAGNGGSAVVLVFTESAGVRGIPSKVDGVAVVPARDGQDIGAPPPTGPQQGRRRRRRRGSDPGAGPCRPDGTL